MAFSCNLQQVVTEFTRGILKTASSLLDLIFVSEPIASCEYDARVLKGISDHLIVIFECIWPNKRAAPVPARVQHYVYDFSKASDESVLDVLELAFDSFENMCLTNN
ncbi:unnamed protein product [Ixodes pacificus]